MWKKGWIVFGVLTALFCGLLGRLWTLVKTQPANVASTQNRWTVSVASTRGTIYDRNNIPLVNGEKSYYAAIAPSVTALSVVRQATTDQQFISLRTQLEKGHPAAVRLTKPIALTQGIRLFYVPVRYAERQLAPHIIGYLDSSKQHGVFGIEQGYDELLNSYRGKAAISFYVDGNGRFLAGIESRIEDTTVRSSGGVILTLDRDIQKIIEDIGHAYLKKGAIILQNSSDGAILAMASFPDFHPNNLAFSLEKNDGAFLNRALSLYDCGSVFKIITTAAALEQGVSVNATVECDGSVNVDGTLFHCHNRLGHGRLTMTDAFAQSCNIYYIKLAQQIGANAVYKIAQKMGLQHQLSPAASITAVESLLPDLTLLQSSSAALANFSFGQGYLLTTPLHVAQLTSIIMNDGILMPPSLVKGLVDEAGIYTSVEQGRGVRVLSKSAAKTIRGMMTAVVQYGTGQAAQTNCVSVAGKTGTAETGQINTDGNRVVQSWFTGYYPTENPEYGITVLVEDAQQSGVKATEIFKKIVETLCEKN